MPKPRKRLVSLEATPYYHCISRCVRRAFLCGTDTRTGFDFSHRRGWIVDRMKQLSKIFAMDINGYAVMSNHYHIILRIDQDAADAWTNREVAERWLQLFKGPDSIKRWLAGDVSGQGELDRVGSLIDLWRSRLKDLSWYMRCLNEYIARLANQEDGCCGRFWEGRFKSQALLDERALLACMAYVDLNPIRAGMAKTPEASEFTSLRERIRNPDTTALAPFQDQSTGHVIPFAFEDYLQLVDWGGRAVRAGKSGSIPENAPPILQRLSMDPSEVLNFMTQRVENPTHALGPVSLLRELAQSVGLKFLKGIGLGRRLCPEPG